METVNRDCSSVLTYLLVLRLGEVDKVGGRITQGRVSIGVRAVPALLSHTNPCEVRSKA